MTNQQQRIYGFMKQNGSITPMDAFKYLAITKLSTRIGEMKREGINIGSEMVKGKESRYMRYWLEDE